MLNVTTALNVPNYFAHYLGNFKNYHRYTKYWMDIETSESETDYKPFYKRMGQLVMRYIRIQKRDWNHNLLDILCSLEDYKDENSPTLFIKNLPWGVRDQRTKLPQL